MKIFRKIRQRLLSDKKPKGRMARFGKYMVYAVGEIILVVIGILIALQFNVRKENDILSQKQQKHLVLIRGEMVNNLNSLEIEEEAFMGIMESTRTILDLMTSDQQIKEISEENLSRVLIDIVSRQIKVHHENGALTELISSGGLKDVKSDSIRSMLASWEGRLKGIRSQEQSLYKYFDKISSLSVNLGSFRNLFEDIGYTEALGIKNSPKRKSNKQLLRSAEFENVMLNYLAISYSLHNRNYDSFRKDLKKLIRLLDAELKAKE